MFESNLFVETYIFWYQLQSNLSSYMMSIILKSPIFPAAHAGIHFIYLELTVFDTRFRLDLPLCNFRYNVLVYKCSIQSMKMLHMYLGIQHYNWKKHGKDYYFYRLNQDHIIFGTLYSIWLSWNYLSVLWSCGRKTQEEISTGCLEVDSTQDTFLVLMPPPQPPEFDIPCCICPLPRTSSNQTLHLLHFEATNIYLEMPWNMTLLWKNKM